MYRFLFCMGKNGKNLPVRMAALLKKKLPRQFPLQPLFPFFISEKSKYVIVSADQNVSFNMVYLCHVPQLTHNIDIYGLG